MKDKLPLLPEDVADIVAILDGSAYETLEIRTARFSLRMSRDAGGWTQSWKHDDLGVAAVEKPAAAAVAVVADEPDDGTAAIRPSIPGTFYRAAKPGAPPFVEVGAAVGVDTVVGIIETMKVMNSVAAGIAGVVSAIVAVDGQLVNQSTVLVRVRPG